MQDLAFATAFLRKHGDKLPAEARADLETYLYGAPWDSAPELMRGWILATVGIEPTPGNAGAWATLPPDVRQKLAGTGPTWTRKLATPVVVAAR